MTKKKPKFKAKEIKKEKVRAFEKIRDDVLLKLKLPWWAVIYKLNAKWLPDDVGWRCDHQYKYNEATIHIRMSKEEIEDIIKKDWPFVIRQLFMHEVIHTWFSFYNEPVDELKSFTGNYMIINTLNALLVHEESIVSHLQNKLHEAYRPEEYNKNKNDYWL